MRFSRFSTLPTNRDMNALLGDDVELVQPLFIPAEGQAGENSWTAVSRAQIDRKTRLPCSSPATVGHEVGAFVDDGYRHGLSSREEGAGMADVPGKERRNHSLKAVLAPVG